MEKGKNNKGTTAVTSPFLRRSAAGRLATSLLASTLSSTNNKRHQVIDKKKI